CRPPPARLQCQAPAKSHASGSPRLAPRAAKRRQGLENFTKSWLVGMPPASAASGKSRLIGGFRRCSTGWSTVARLPARPYLLAAPAPPRCRNRGRNNPLCCGAAIAIENANPGAATPVPPALSAIEEKADVVLAA